ncbi:MAG TPA: hypothetical protein VHA78_05650 [Candidatus Peribacteraceae bacterium]|nr:hypothetical protein [Candidatus Peribacteraceae bacterium]
MIPISHIKPGCRIERESRVLFFAQQQPESFTDKIAKRDDLKGDFEEYNKLTENNKDIETLFNHFSQKKNVTVDDLKEYIFTKQEEGKLNAFEEDIFHKLSCIFNPDLEYDERKNAEAAIKKLVAYINLHNGVVATTQQKVKNLREQVSPVGMAPKQVTSLESMPVNTAKDFLGRSWNAFKEAGPGDKALIAGGVFAVFLVALKSWNTLMKQDKGVFGALKNVLGIALGGYVTYKAGQALDRSYSKIYGHRLFTMGNVVPGGLSPWTNQEEWNEYEYQQQLNTVTNKLKELKLPQSFMDDVNKMAGSQTDVRLMKGVANLSVLSVPDFIGIYNEAKANGGVIPNGLWPQRPCPESRVAKDQNLTPLERFQLMKEIGTSIGLIDKAGNAGLPKDPALRDQSVLYLILDEQKPTTEFFKNGESDEDYAMIDVDMPLDQLVEHLGKLAGKKTVLDKQALASIGVNDSMPIIYQKKAPPLFALQEVTGSLNLKSIEIGGTIHVTTPDRAEQLVKNASI